MDHPGSIRLGGRYQAPHTIHIDRTALRPVGTAALGAAEDERAARNSFGGPWIGKIADYDLDGEPGQACCAHYPPYQHPHMGAMFDDESFDQPPADESGGARHEDGCTRQLRCAYGRILPAERCAVGKSQG